MLVVAVFSLGICVLLLGVQQYLLLQLVREYTERTDGMTQSILAGLSSIENKPPPRQAGDDRAMVAAIWEMKASLEGIVEKNQTATVSHGLLSYAQTREDRRRRKVLASASAEDEDTPSDGWLRN